MKKLRTKIIAGNWKMNMSLAEAENLASGVKRELASFREADVVMCPPFTALKLVGDVIADTHIRLGAQNMHWEPSGAYTGEIGAVMLRDLYCRYVILGHSERRTYFHETDETVGRKVKAAMAANLIPIVCVGETLREREAAQTEAVVRRQLEQGLAGLGRDIAKLIVAYEPVWAIGTGRTASPQQAQDVHAFIRTVVTGMADADTAQTLRILYGGSMKPSNAGDLMGQPDIDGGLIGGASLDVASFVDIIRAAV